MKKLLNKYDAMPLPAKAAVWFAVCSALQSGVAFIAIPFLTRLMSQEQYGVVTLYNSWRQIVIIFATLNIYAGVFNIGMVKWPERRDGYLTSMVGLTFVLTGMVTIVYFCFRKPLNSFFLLTTPYMLVMMAQLFASTVFSLWSARQRFEYRYKPILAATVAYTVASQVGSVMCVWLAPAGADKAFISVASLTAVTLAVAFGLVVLIGRRSVTFCNLSFWKHAVMFNLPLVPHYLSTLVLGQANRIMIANMVGTEAAAIYGVAHTIGLMIQIITGAITNAVIPWMFERLGGRKPAGISSLIEVLTLCVGAANLVAIMVAPEIMKVAAPESYSAATYVIPPVALSMLLAFVYGLFANVELFYEKNLWVMLASVVAAVANIVLDWLLIPLGGYLAAAYVTLICYGLLALAHYLFAKRAAHEVGLDGLFEGKRIGLCLAAFVPPTAIAVAFYQYPVVRAVLIVVVCASCYAKKESIMSIVRQIREKREGALSGSGNSGAKE